MQRRKSNQQCQTEKTCNHSNPGWPQPPDLLTERHDKTGGDASNRYQVENVNLRQHPKSAGHSSAARAEKCHYYGFRARYFSVYALMASAKYFAVSSRFAASVRKDAPNSNWIASTPLVV